MLVLVSFGSRVHWFGLQPRTWGFVVMKIFWSYSVRLSTDTDALKTHKRWFLQFPSEGFVCLAQTYSRWRLAQKSRPPNVTIINSFKVYGKNIGSLLQGILYIWTHSYGYIFQILNVTHCSFKDLLLPIWTFLCPDPLHTTEYIYRCFHWVNVRFLCCLF